jgi:hypothetical protein
MKNTFICAVISIVLFLAVLGCSSLNPFSDSPKPGNTQVANTRNGNTPANSKEKTLPEKAIDTAVGEETTGVPECDEVLNSLAEMAKSPEDEGYLMRTARGVLLNKVRTSLKQSIEENKNDKVELAGDCKDLKAEIDKYNASSKEQGNKN